MVEIYRHVEEYLKRELPLFQLITVFKVSYHLEDTHLYHVIGRKNDGTYAHWSSWNEETGGLNGGVYDIQDLAGYLEQNGLKRYVSDVDTQESSVIRLTSSVNEWIDIMIFPLEDERFLEAKLMASRAFTEWCQNSSQEAVGSYLELRMKEAGIPCIFYYPGERNGN